MESIWPLVVALIAGVGVLIFGKARSSKRKGVQTPPKNSAADIARETVQQTFEEEVTGVFEAVKGDDPAGDLAGQGNARSRK
jgi:hypothetical protein